jgi:hypothetical protein
MAVDDLCDYVGEVIARFDVTELAGLDQRGDDGPVLAAAVGAGEKRVFAVERVWPDRAFDDVAIDFDAAVVEEAGQPFPMRQGVADSLGELGLLANQGKLGLEPGFEDLDKRPTFLLSERTALIGVAAPALGLDGVEFSNTFECSLAIGAEPPTASS